MITRRYDECSFSAVPGLLIRWRRRPDQATEDLSLSWLTAECKVVQSDQTTLTVGNAVPANRVLVR